MAILMTNRSDIGPDLYDGVIDHLRPHLQGADGFRGHFAGLAPDGNWTVVEIWDSAEQQARFFDEYVRPYVVEGSEPAIYQLHNVVQASPAVAK